MYIRIFYVDSFYKIGYFLIYAAEISIHPEQASFDAGFFYCRFHERVANAFYQHIGADRQFDSCRAAMRHCAQHGLLLAAT